MFYLLFFCKCCIACLEIPFAESLYFIGTIQPISATHGITRFFLLWGFMVSIRREKTAFLCVNANQDRFLSCSSSICGLVKAFINIMAESNTSCNLYNLSDNSISATGKSRSGSANYQP